MSDEVRAAAERWRKDYPATMAGVTQCDADSRTMSDAYIAHLDQQAAEERERALPVDAEWLMPISRHAAGDHSYWFCFTDELCVARHSSGFRLQCGDWIISENANRGHVLDAMKLFGVVPPTKDQS